MTSKTRSALGTEQTTNFADNTSGAITPAILRTTVQDMIDSTGTLLDANSWSGSAYSFTGSVAFTGSVVTYSAATVFIGSAGGLLGGSASTSTLILQSTNATSPLTDQVNIAASTILVHGQGSVPGTFQVGVAGSAYGQIAMAGSTSGNTTIITTAAASGTQTLQAATDTFVYLSTTDTLTNKTIDTAAPNTLKVSGVTLSRGQYPGTNTNDNATAGNFGEEVESVIVLPGGAILTGSTANITTISLTAGDWDVDAVGQFCSSTTTNITHIQCGISSTAATLDITGGRTNSLFLPATTPGVLANPAWTLVVPPVRWSLSATTTINFVYTSTFSAGTLNVGGIVRGRRVR